MGAADVIQCLQALDVPSLGLSAGEKKAKLKGELGLAKTVVEEKDAGGSGSGSGGEEKKEKTPTPAEKARTNTENAKRAAEVRRKVLEAKAKKAEGGKK